ncbi:MAG: tetratricopeptide repeat protein [Paracoccus sp. (in: a-proteobacteria)]|uniref:tetratricopeptide repeat protein n=1 Tax=Paracoccus sp. TaxID=267 RepID=UPI0026DED003|nr:tetratricopeptide repeat protein [Paracoccus sp. (in: a-proteobacteria)]MDO5630575.1 tetratricopeptide repeat protein [Paracoccus sp. (in: a-proteobacteria)]
MTRSTRRHAALIVTLIAAMAGQTVAAQDDAAPAEAAEQAETASSAPLTRGLAGPYLAGRMAATDNDFRAAADYFLRTVSQDPGNAYLEDSALIALVSSGRFDQAATVAHRIADQQEHPSELSGLVRRADLARAGDWPGLIALLDAAPPLAQGEPPGRVLLDEMLRGWAQMGAGQATEALATFEDLTRIPGAQGMVNYHLALARAMAGDYEGAADLLADPQTGAHILGFIARAQILAQLDRHEDAIDMLDAIQGIESEPMLLALRAQLVTGMPVAFDVIRSPQDGMAQVFLTFGMAMAQAPGPDPDPLALIHARLASWLAPELGEARLMVAQLLQSQGQFDLAEQEFDALAGLGAVRPVAELARIDALSRAERKDEAEKAALALTAAYPDLPQAWIALGDLLRQQAKHAAAVPAYDKALTLLADAPDEARWFPLYARGIALERSAQFDRAEADFLAAIEIRPDQASLLNYLGYSWIDRNMNLERGLDMIKQAVELAPNDGYIQDSLAWAYYRLGRYDEAVAPMENAARSMSNDPLINDHLGDIYWMVGRKREAEIQWRRALSLLGSGAQTEEDMDPDRLRAKLDRGLDAVLADEPAGNGGARSPAGDADPQP